MGHIYCKQTTQTDVRKKQKKSYFTLNKIIKENPYLS